MYHLLITFILSFSSFLLVAQDEITAGVIRYEKVVQIEITLQGEAARYQDQVPRERRIQKELLFNEKSSLFRNIPRNPEEAAMEDGGPGGRMRFRMMEPEDVVFHDLETNKAVEQREFMTRKFLINSDPDTLKWKLTGKQKLILDLMCLEAELVGAAKKTIAWFTPMIPISTGPDGYGNLPGLILVLDIEDGKTLVTATGIDHTPPSNQDLVEPLEGKKMTRKEYDLMVEEKIKEMQESGMGRGIMIRRF